MVKGQNVDRKLVDSSPVSHFIAFQQCKTELKEFFDVIHADWCNHFVIIILHTFKKYTSTTELFNLMKWGKH